MSNNLVDEWNRVFQFKITVTDLQRSKQNCTFLTDAFSCFLKAIQIDVESVKAKIGDVRKFRIYLAKYIDHFVHVVCNKPSRFLYGDLINPKTKKTSGVLKLLVNYYLYFIMVKDEVVKNSSAKIEEHNRLMYQLNEMKIQREVVKVETINKQQALDVYNKSILEDKKLSEELKVKNSSLVEATADVVQRLKSITAENIGLHSQLTNLHPLIVTEAELNDLMKKINDANDRISSFDTLEQKISAENQLYFDEVNRLTADIEAFDSETLSGIEQGDKESRLKKLNEIKKQIEKTKTQIEDIEQQRKTCLNLFQSSQDQLSKKKDDLKMLMVYSGSQKLSTESECKRLTLENIELQQSIESAEHDLENVQVSQAFIVEKGAQVIQHIANSSHK